MFHTLLVITDFTYDQNFCPRKRYNGALMSLDFFCMISYLNNFYLEDFYKNQSEQHRIDLIQSGLIRIDLNWLEIIRNDWKW